MNWEYYTFEPRLVRDSDENRSDYILRVFNELGAEGWEFVSMVEYNFMFKRPLATKSVKKTGQSSITK